MLEFHGWANIVLTSENVDIWNESELLDEAANNLRHYMQELEWGSGTLGITAVNGQYHVWVSGFRNRKDYAAEEVVELFRYISTTAPGSYGLLYILDSADTEGFDNVFQVYVLVRGTLIKRCDPFLSPFRAIVEDP